MISNNNDNRHGNDNEIEQVTFIAACVPAKHRTLFVHPRPAWACRW